MSMLNRFGILGLLVGCLSLGAITAVDGQPAVDPAGLPEGFSIEDFKFRQDQLDKLQAHLRKEVLPSSKSPTAENSAEIKEAIRQASVGDPRFLISLVSSPDEGLVEFALTGLAVQFGSSARMAAPKIFPLLTDSRERGRIARLAAEALGKIGAGDATVAATLGQRLIKTPDKDVLMKCALIDALGRVGEASRPVAAQIRVLLKDPSIKVQYRSVLALHQIETPAPLSVDQWLDGTPVARRDPALLSDLLPLLTSSPDRGQDLADRLVKAAVATGPSYLTPLAFEAMDRAHWFSPDSVRLALESLASADPFLSLKASECLVRIDPTAAGAVPAIGAVLRHSDPKVRTQAALALKRFGPASASEARSMAAALSACDGTTAESELAAYLDVLKSMGSGGAPAAETLVTLMRDRSPVFRNREKLRIHHLRGYMLATLAEIGTPASALPIILDSLANSENSNPYLFAAAARAAASLGPQASATVPHLLRAFSGGLRDEFISFESLVSHRSSTGEYTSCLVEAIRALAKVGPEARDAVPHLQGIIAQPSIRLNGVGRLQRLPDITEEARKAIKAIAS